ncbi:hypothetical protein DMB44_03755 [Thermoplasma sp. Kam2015]|nr:hypothetical protein DMB44_03755 [Thermoplasma sp. Kam2015]
MHKKRIAHILSVVSKEARMGDKIGIIGYSVFDDMFREHIKNAFFYNIVPNEDFIETKYQKYHDYIIFYDITDSSSSDPPIKFDLIIFTEVLEHLLAKDEIILINISKLIKDRGKLIFSVPNVSALGKIVSLNFGKNPYMTKDQILNGSFSGYGHIREYSFNEVKTLLSKNFRIIRLEGWNDYPNKFNKISKILPKIYAETIFALCEKP